MSPSSGSNTSRDGQPPAPDSPSGPVGHRGAEPTSSAGSNAAHATKRRRTRRLPLSCGECRKKKLSCDRHQPCQRCMRSGRPDQCSFETGKPVPATKSDGTAQQTASVRDDPQIQELRAEISQLREVLSKIVHASVQQQDDKPCNSTAEPLRELVDASQGLLPSKEPRDSSGEVPRDQIIALKDRSPRGYYRQHTLFRFFDEMPQLFPFIKETADEWFKPRGINLRKGKAATTDNAAPQPQHKALQDLIPPKEETDILVSFYLERVETLHRILDIHSLKREYALYWSPHRPQHPGMTTLILAMISISTPISTDASASKYRSMPPTWIAACDSWLAQHATKGRKLVYYQVACLIYLAKRINMIRKKRFWIETGSLVQNAILDGLHLEEPYSSSCSPYVKENKSRIWAVVRELDLQNSFEYELPTLLHNLECRIPAPANVDDEELENSTPKCKTSDNMTDTSYQALSSRSWELRLEISKRLFSTGTTKALPYDEVLQYTHRLTQALDSLPLWCKKSSIDSSGAAESLLVSAFLQFQLKECILAIHRPYLQGDDSHSSLSGMICHHAAREVLLMNRELSKHAIQGLLFFREDLLVAAMTLTRLTLNQPTSSAAVTNADSEATIGLLEQCLPFAEDRYLRCLHGEPWCPLTMYGILMLLKIRLGQETHQTAKSACAHKFLDLYYKHFSRQATSDSNRGTVHSINDDVFQTESIASAQGWQLPQKMDCDYTNFDMDWTNFDIDWQFGAMWDTELPWDSP